jgi:Uma2 family endonuclease
VVTAKVLQHVGGDQWTWAAPKAVDGSRAGRPNNPTRVCSQWPAPCAIEPGASLSTGSAADGRDPSAYGESMTSPDGGGRMTAQPLPPNPSSSSGIEHPLTTDEYVALGEVEHGQIELQEGSLVVSPSPTAFHMLAIAGLLYQLKPQLPTHLVAIPDVDIDLELVPRTEPGSSRRPDLIVVDRTALQRIADEGGLIRASEVSVVVDVVSAGSRRMDNIAKRGEYADAAIGYYWIVDIEKPASLVECHPTEQFGYQDGGAVTGSFRTAAPFEATIDLDTLV